MVLAYSVNVPMDVNHLKLNIVYVTPFWLTVSLHVQHNHALHLRFESKLFSHAASNIEVQGPFHKTRHQ